MRPTSRSLPRTFVALGLVATLGLAGAAEAAPRPAARRTQAAKPAVAKPAVARPAPAPAPAVPTIEILQPAPEAHAFRGSAYVLRWRCPDLRAADTVRIILACQPPQGGPVEEFWSCSVPNAGSAKVRIPADLELPDGAPLDSFRLGLQQQLPETARPRPPVAWQVLRLH